MVNNVRNDSADLVVLINGFPFQKSDGMLVGSKQSALLSMPRKSFTKSFSLLKY